MEVQTIQNVLSVLMIEDNPGDVRIIEEILKESTVSFYKVTHSSCLKDGIKILNENKFDILILDLRLPDSSDLNTLKFLRECNAQIPIIVLTIANNEELGLLAIQNGAQDFLIKDQIDASTLEKSIKFAIERKKLEQRIVESENLFESTFEQAAVGMVHQSAEGKYIKVNQKFCDLLGFTREELIGRSMELITHQNDIKPDLLKLNQLLKKEIDSFDLEKRMIRKDGTIIWVHVTCSMIKTNSSTRPIVFSIIEDINIKKRTETILNQAFENYKALAENSPEIINRFDRNFNFIYTNSAIYKVSGRTPKDIIGRNLADITNDENFKNWYPRFQKVIETKKKHYFQDIIHTLKGEMIVETIFIPEFDENREISSFLTISRDVTKRMKAQEEIQSKNILLEKILENIPAGIWIINENGELIMHNKTCEDIWGGVENITLHKKPEFNGWWAYNNKRLEPTDWASYRAYTAGQTSLNEIINIETYDSKKKTIMNSAVPMFDNSKKLLGVIVINQDISNIMQIENELKTSLEEKEMLMKEIHHRVKNNFQIIVSLLNLQRSTLKHKSIEDVLLESQNRIRAMAIVHEKLYKSKNIHTINFTHYLKDLLATLQDSYTLSDKQIKFELELDELFVSSDYAINIGLIINELISNSLKHAFIDRSEGTIRITLRKNCEIINLIVKDNGVGIDESINIKTTDSLGMLVINSFVNQLKGTVELRRENGTEFSINFPME